MAAPTPRAPSGCVLGGNLFATLILVGVVVAHAAAAFLHDPSPAIAGPGIVLYAPWIGTAVMLGLGVLTIRKRLREGRPISRILFFMGLLPALLSCGGAVVAVGLYIPYAIRVRDGVEVIFGLRQYIAFLLVGAAVSMLPAALVNFTAWWRAHVSSKRPAGDATAE